MITVISYVKISSPLICTIWQTLALSINLQKIWSSVYKTTECLLVIKIDNHEISRVNSVLFTGYLLLVRNVVI